MESPLRLTSHPCHILASRNQITPKYDFFNRYTKRQSEILNCLGFNHLTFSNRYKFLFFSWSFLTTSSIFCISRHSATRIPTLDPADLLRRPPVAKACVLARPLPSNPIVITRTCRSAIENQSLTMVLPHPAAALGRQLAPPHYNRPLRLTVLLLLFAFAPVRPASAADLKQQTTAAFDRYVALSEARINSSLSLSETDPAPFLWVDTLPASQRVAALAQLRSGKIVIEKLTTLDDGKPIPVPGGLIHHWIGIVFIPGATLAQTLALVQDYDHHAQYYSPQVIASKIISRNGDDFRIYLRLYEKKILTCVLDTRHEVHYVVLDSAHAWSRSRTTEVREVADWKQADEHDLPAGRDDGFLWRMNTYWRFEQKDGGVYVECQSISLTRDIPTGLGWLIGPFVESIPRESLEFTLGATRRSPLNWLPERKPSFQQEILRRENGIVRTQNVVTARKTSANPLRSLFTRLLAAEKNTTSWPKPVNRGLSDWPFPGNPVDDSLTSAVDCVQPVLNPLQVFRTYTFSMPLVVAGTKFVANDENATNCAVLPMLGDSHNPFAGDEPSDAMETSDVVGAQTLPCPVHRSRKYICCVVADAAPKFVAVEANAMNLPPGLMFGSMLAPLANAVPSGVETSSPGFAVQPVVIPMHSATAYTCEVPAVFPSMSVAVELNVTICPNGPDATDGWPLTPPAGPPPLAVEISIVDGVQPPPAFRHVSRKYTSGVPAVAVATRFVAVETKATNLPSPLIATCELGPFAGLTPSPETEIKLTAGVQPEGTPAQVLATNTCGVVPLNVTVGTRFVASDMNASSIPLEFIAGSEPAPFAMTPFGPESISVVLGVHEDVVPRHESKRKMSGTPLVSGFVLEG